MVVAAVAEWAPSVTDAERAAEALAAAGVCEVWLHGSVARGEAGPDSDIDLVAVYPDLDYRQRWDRKCELAELARASCRWEVDVFVTDLPEWTIRSGLLTSFERGIRTRGELLLPRSDSVAGVRWEKEIRLPGSDDREALRTMEPANQTLFGLEMALAPPRGVGRTGEDVWWYRIYTVCREAQMAAEKALKALVHLYGQSPPSDFRDFEALCGCLPPDIAVSVGRILERVDRAEISRWRVVGANPFKHEDEAARGPELAEPFACVAVGLNGYAVDHVEARLGPDPMLDHNRKFTAEVAAWLEEHEVASGRPRTALSPLIPITGLATPRPRQPAGPVSASFGPADA